MAYCGYPDGARRSGDAVASRHEHGDCEGLFNPARANRDKTDVEIRRMPEAGAAAARPANEKVSRGAVNIGAS